MNVNLLKRLHSATLFAFTCVCWRGGASYFPDSTLCMKYTFSDSIKCNDCNKIPLGSFSPHPLLPFIPSSPPTTFPFFTLAFFFFVPRFFPEHFVLLPFHSSQLFFLTLIPLTLLYTRVFSFWTRLLSRFLVLSTLTFSALLSLFCLLLPVHFHLCRCSALLLLYSHSLPLVTYLPTQLAFHCSSFSSIFFPPHLYFLFF